MSGQFGRPLLKLQLKQVTQWLLLSGSVLLLTWLGCRLSLPIDQSQVLSHENLFKQQLSSEEKGLLRQLLDTFDEVAEWVELHYFLADASVIGSIRHHDIIPWDDDVDVGILNTEMDNFMKLVDLLPSKLYTSMNDFRWKICFFDRPHIRQDLDYSHPYLDIAVYNVSGQKMWDQFAYKWDLKPFNVDYVFPLIKRPFLGKLFPMPGQPRKYIRATYNTGYEDFLSNCENPAYLHRQESMAQPHLNRRINCEALWPYYPFVHRDTSKLKDKSTLMNETLVLNGTNIHTWSLYF